MLDAGSVHADNTFDFTRPYLYIRGYNLFPVARANTSACIHIFLPLFSEFVLLFLFIFGIKSGDILVSAADP